MPTLGGERRDIWVDGERRSFLFFGPLGERESQPIPLVLVFHGRGISAAEMVRMTGLEELARREGFWCVFAEGRPDAAGGRFWSVDYTPEAVVTGSRELPFVQAILDEFPRMRPVDPARVYGVGFSNGGILCYALARWLGEEFAALAAVAGIADFGEFELPFATSLLHIHGTRDRFIPYAGGRTARKDMPIIFPPVPMMLDRWRRATGCLTMRAVSTLVDPHEPALVTRVEDFGPGRDDGEMRIVTVEGGGHTWPGRAPIVSYLGPWTTAFSASSLIWEFFAGKRRR